MMKKGTQLKPNLEKERILLAYKKKKEAGETREEGIIVYKKTRLKDQSKVKNAKPLAEQDTVMATRGVVHDMAGSLVGTDVFAVENRKNFKSEKARVLKAFLSKRNFDNIKWFREMSLEYLAVCGTYTTPVKEYYRGKIEITGVRDSLVIPTLPGYYAYLGTYGSKIEEVCGYSEAHQDVFDFVKQVCEHRITQYALQGKVHPGMAIKILEAKHDWDKSNLVENNITGVVFLPVRGEGTEQKEESKRKTIQLIEEKATNTGGVNLPGRV